MLLDKKYYSMSPLQKGILFQNQASKLVDQAYVNCVEITLKEAVSLTKLNRAIHSITKKYEALRSYILPVELKVGFDPSAVIDCEYLDYSEMPTSEKENIYKRKIQQLIKEGFDIKKTPLIRFLLVKFDSNNFQLVVLYHHVILAGQCVLDILLDLFRFYDTEDGIEHAISNIPLFDFSLLESQIHSKKANISKKFITQALSEIEHSVFLPTTEGEENGSLIESDFLIDSARTKQIKLFCKTNGITVNLFLQFVWGLVLRLYSGHSKIIFGITRELPKKLTHGRCGFLINTMPRVMNVSLGHDIEQCLNNLKEHAYYDKYNVLLPLSELKSCTNISYESTFFDVLYDYKPLTPNQFMNRYSPKWREKGREVNFRFSTNYPFMIEMFGLDDKLGGRITAHTSMYGDELVEQIIRHFKAFLDTSVRCDIKSSISNLFETVSYSSFSTMSWIAGEPAVACEAKTFDNILEQSFVRYKNEVAVRCRKQTLTYSELKEKRDRFAKLIQQKFPGCHHKSMLVTMDRSILSLPLILALFTLKITYIPLDPNYPKNKLKKIREQCLPDYFLDLRKKHQFNVNDIESINYNYSHDTKRDIAYIIFTTGTTGRPKGVMISRSSLDNLLLSFCSKIGLSKKDVFFAVSSFSFDIAYLELFLPLLSGACCYIATEGEIKSPQKLIQQMCIYGATTLQATPTYLRTLVRYGRLPEVLNKVISGGEPLTSDLIALLHQVDRRIWNAYGPTETTIWSTLAEVTLKTNNFENVITLGQPIHNTHISILNDKNVIMPRGAIGEIVISGAGVALGYINSDLIEDEVFFNQSSNEMLIRSYRTGDFGYIDLRGQLHFVGRKDEQVKISGHRIELVEVEEAIRVHCTVNNVAVIAHKNHSSTHAMYLIAYYESKQEIELMQFQLVLKKVLPGYAIPKMYVRLSQLPVTTSGKINKKELPLPESLDTVQSILSPEERLLADVWADTLKIDRVSLNANSHFFQLGGNSIDALMITNKMMDIFHIKVPPNTLFSHPTIYQFSEHIKNLIKRETPAIYTIKESIQPAYPLSYQQERLFAYYHLYGPQSTYNMFIVYDVGEGINVSALEQAIIALVDKHSALRTIYRSEGGEIQQLICSPSVFQIETEKLANQEQCHELQKMFSAHKFKLEEEIPFKVKLIQVKENGYYLMINIHHIACDGWSLKILKRDLQNFYTMAEQQGRIKVDKGLAYKDYSVSQKQHLNQGYLQEKSEYWMSKLKNCPALILPKRPINGSESNKCFRTSFQIVQKSFFRVQSFCRKHKVTPFVALLSLFSIMLYRHTYQKKFILNVPTTGRVNVDTQEIVGFFVNVLPLIIDFHEISSLINAVKAIEKEFLTVFKDQEFPFNTLANVPMQILFVMQESIEAKLNFQGIESKRVYGDNDSLLLSDFDTSKFELTFYLQEKKDHYDGLVEYNCDLYSSDYIDMLINTFQLIISSALSDPKCQINGITWGNQPEIYSINLMPTYKQPHAYSAISQWLNNCADHHSDTLAIKQGNSKHTFSELLNDAKKLSRFIQSKKLNPKYPIAIQLSSDIQAVVAMISVLQAGFCYLPLDINLPESRVDFILDDANVVLVINDAFMNEYKLFSGTYHQSDITIQHSELAYIMYTSGTTGHPKGVQVKQSNIVHLMNSASTVFDWEAHETWCLLHTLTFDFSVWEIWGALLTGATLIVPEQDYRLQPDRLVDWLSANKISVLNLTPSIFNLIIAQLKQSARQTEKLSQFLRYVILGGETIARVNLSAWFDLPISESVKVVNMYGITEATVHSSFHHITRDDLYSSNKSNIGKSLPGVEILLLDEEHKKTPPNMIGEICIVGHGVASGYLNESDEKTSGFLAELNLLNHPCPIFKTGDLARQWDNGDLEYIGRIDSQVNRRGYRIGTAEIKELALAYPSIQEAITDIHPNANETLIDLYICIENVISHDEIKNYIDYWAHLYNQTYTDSPFSGWKESYNHQDIPHSHMKEWLANTISRLVQVKPKHVFEFGCGTGLLFFELLSHVRRYGAYDISKKAISLINKKLKDTKVRNKVQFFEDIRNIEAIRFIQTSDLFILNSVVQYFPNADYFEQVIHNALDLLPENSHLFIGDVRDLSYSQAYYRSRAAHDQIDDTQLEEYIENCKRFEKELLIDHRYFCELLSLHRRVNYVKIELKSGRYLNEMNNYRYDITIGVETPQPTKAPIVITWIDHQFETIQGIVDKINELKPSFIGLKDLVNQRISIKNCGINPGNLSYLLKNIGYETVLLFSSSHPETHFDAIVYQPQYIDEIETYFFTKNQKNRHHYSLESYFNNPIYEANKKRNLTNFYDYLMEKLPKYMRPDRIFYIDRVPVTPSGKVDYLALRASGQLIRRDTSASYTLTETEQVLSKIWGNLLNISHSAPNEDFFALGGHSLLALQLLSEIENHFQVKLPLKLFMTHSSLSTLAKLIDNMVLEKGAKKLGFDYHKSLGSPIVVLRKQGEGCPLFLFHPIGGSVFPYLELVQYLEPTRPIYAIQDPAIDGQARDYHSLQEMVTDYLKYIKTIQPRGPYLFAGSSLGGTLAYEAAYQVAITQDVRSGVFMFDSWALYSEELADKKRLKQGLMRQYELMKSKLTSIKLINPMLWLDLHFNRLNLVLNYKPSLLEFDVALFKATTLKSEFKAIDEASNHWGKYCNGAVHSYLVPGDHESMMVVPNVKQLALLLDKEVCRIGQVFNLHKDIAPAFCAKDSV